MNDKQRNPSTQPSADEPKGDLGEKGKTWSPGQEQGISNRPGDEAEVGQAEDDEFEEDDSEEEQEGEGGRR